MMEQEFRSAFHEHKDAVYGFALRMTGSVQMAEDVAQDCFLELLRHPGRFDAGRGSLRQFMLGVARNLVYRRWRADQRFDQIEDDQQWEAPDFTAGPISSLIAAAVQSLPPLQREAILLFEYEGFTLEEIAGLVSADVGTVKSRLHRAREKLRHVLAPLRNVDGRPVK
jgi:RNA polymerase sigma-70 factor (ECF subfamily)